MKKAITPKLDRRPSKLVPRKTFQAIARREKLNAMLRVHDLEKPLRTQSFDEKDWAILRQIAQEGAMTNIGPAPRAAAIFYLAKSPTPENLNLLTELARRGEDFYVRGQALLALGATGLRLAAPVIAAGLDAKERFECVAAERGLALLGRRHSMAALRDILTEKRWNKALTRIEKALAAAPPRRRGRKRITVARPAN